MDTGQGRDTNRSALPGGAGRLGVARVGLGKAGELPGHHTLGGVILPRETWERVAGTVLVWRLSRRPCCGPRATAGVLSRNLTNQPRPLSAVSYELFSLSNPSPPPRPETWWVLCYMNNTGGAGPGWTGGERHGQQTDSVHGEDATLLPGEAWPQEVLLTQQ